MGSLGHQYGAVRNNRGYPSCILTFIGGQVSSDSPYIARRESLLREAGRLGVSSAAHAVPVMLPGEYIRELHYNESSPRVHRASIGLAMGSKIFLIVLLGE